MARTLESRTIRGLGAGALAGLAAWILVEKTGWFAALLNNTGGIAPGSHVYRLQVALGGLYGLVVAIGICLGDWSEQTADGARFRMLALRGLTGFVGGAVGMMLGFWAYTVILPASESALPPTDARMVLGVVARGIGWAFIGLAIGAGQGGLRRSVRTVGLGAAGGFMGGLAGGGFFEAMEAATSNPMLARLIGFVFVGASIGFFLNFVPLMMKQAWIRIIRGRGEGGEFLLEKRWTSVGRSETADVSLFGDPGIAPIHFLIETGPTFSLLRPAHKQKQEPDLSAIIVNGSAIDADTPLTGGESIDIGSFGLKFYLKETSSPSKNSSRPGGSVRAHAPSSRPNPPNVPRSAYKAPKADPLRPEEVGHVASSRRLADDGLTGTKLHCAHGPYFDQVFALATRDRLILGRGSEADISLANDKAVSRAHCAILLVSGRHWIEDAKSANGTFLNEARLKSREPIMLKPGDKIKLGDTVFEYE